MGERVIVGMSGGVDSSAAALLLREKGYDVTGVTLRLRPGAKAEEEDAREVAEKLGIPHIVVDFQDEFRREVIQRFIQEYEAGRTPSPCVVCNRAIKFGAMLRWALQNGFSRVATGHYARVCQREDGRWLLYRAPDRKDQSYMLYSLSQEQLRHILTPLAGMSKEQARALAQEAGLPVAHKPDSQEICFIPDGDYVSFLERDTGRSAPAGDFVDENGKILGRHQGITRYTIGQRKGLGVAFGKPMYVTRLDPVANTVTLGPEGSQYASSLLAGELNFIPFDKLEGTVAAQGKVRYQARPAEVRLTMQAEGVLRAEFAQPQRSVTPGQAVVFYQGDLVLGGGTIL